MTALLAAPTRRPVYLSNVYTTDDSSDDDSATIIAISPPLDDHDINGLFTLDRHAARDRRIGSLQLDSRHDCVRSLLITGSTWSGKNERHTVLRVSVPEIAIGLSRSIAVPKLRSGRIIGVERGYRSLTAPCTTMATGIVDTAAIETAPNSPPELSYSKSSKSDSSSFRSSSDDDSTEKLSHFEDITLGEAERVSLDDSNLKPESRPTLRRPPPRSATSIDVLKQRNGMQRTSELREMPNGLSRNRYPSLQVVTGGVIREQSLNLPAGRGMRRGFTSPTSPSMHMLAPNQMSSSRSPSPTKPFFQHGAGVSPQSATTPRGPSSLDLPGTLTRTTSWRSKRKTTKELEDEYHDSDEEVPDEAILGNVPISPMPGMPGISMIPSLPRLNSRTPSPHSQRRPSHSNSSYSNLHSANVPRKAKRPSAPKQNAPLRSPRSPNTARPKMMPHSATVGAFPSDHPGRKHKPKSWTEDLNEEARQLSAALEEFAVEKNGSAPNSAPGSPPRPSFSSKNRTKSTITELPPVQKGNVMIDPLPISKEKEAVLTRTRPSWLPPKCQKEEKKHIKEWEQMMARAAEAEKKRVLKEQETQENKQEMQGSVARIWEQHVLPNWDTVVREPRTRELWWRGITPSSRGTVWQKAIGNELSLSASSFEAALTRSRDLETKLAAMPSEERAKSKEAAWLDAIARDVPSVFPELGVFKDSASSSRRALSDVLKAYTLYRSDLGYIYGTHLIAGLLCLNLRPADAFVTLANMLNRPLSLAFLVHDQGAMARAYDLVFSTLKYKFSKLHAHLTSPALGLKPEEFLDPIFRCLFAYNFSPEQVSRVWDIFVFEGDKALIRAAVAVLGKLEPKLYGTRDEVLDVISWRNEQRWDFGSEEDFIAAVREAGKVDGRGEVNGP